MTSQPVSPFNRITPEYRTLVGRIRNMILEHPDFKAQVEAAVNDGLEDACYIGLENSPVYEDLKMQLGALMEGKIFTDIVRKYHRDRILGDTEYDEMIDRFRTMIEADEEVMAAVVACATRRWSAIGEINIHCAYGPFVNECIYHWHNMFMTDLCDEHYGENRTKHHTKTSS